MSFYTFVDRVGSKIFHRYIDENGKRQQEIVSGFPIDLFIKGRGPDRDLFGTPLHRLSYDSINDAMNFIREHKSIGDVYGQTSLAHQFISHTYPQDIQFDLSKLRIMNFDIEVRHDGYDDHNIVRVRDAAGEREIEVGEAKTNLPRTAEVFDEYTGKWYPVDQSPIWREGGFPEASKAEYEVVSISAKVFGSERKFTFGLKDYNTVNDNQVYKKFDSEAALLTGFVDFVGALSPDIFTGWNIESFDIPYMVNRIRKMLGDGMANKLSPFHAHCRRVISEYNIGTKDSPEIGYRILGITTLDYIALYKKYNPVKRESYALDAIAEIEIGENKVDYSEFDNSLMKLFRDGYDKFVEYNERDVELVERLDDKKQFIRLALTVIMMTKSRYQEVMGAVKLWDNLVYNFLLKENVVIPPDIKYSADTQIVGAYVKEPIPARYEWGATLDLTSLYPSICMMLNMSPETKVRDETGTVDNVQRMLAGEDLAKECRDGGLVMAVNGAGFRKDIQGVLPRAMRYVFDSRKHYKNLMLDAKREKEELLAELKTLGLSLTRQDEIKKRLVELDARISAFDSAQNALKILANSGYGVLAQPSFRYFNREIAQGITVTGQLVIQYAGKVLNNFLNKRFNTNRDYITTQDTDSCFLQLDNVPTDPTNIQQSVDEIDRFIIAEIDPLLERAFESLSRVLGADKNMMDMKREAIFRCGIWRAKKNYVLEVYDNENVRFVEPQYKMMGIETQRSDRPMIVRKELEKCLKIILAGSEEQLQKEVADFKTAFYTATIGTIATPKGVHSLAEWSKPDGTWLSRAPGHVRASLIHNSIIDKKNLKREVERIKSGNKIRIMPLVKANPWQGKSIAFVNEPHPALGLDAYFDKNEQWNKAFISPLESFTNIVGWSVTKKSSLAGLFG